MENPSAESQSEAPMPTLGTTSSADNAKTNYYPNLTITHIQNPNRLYAIPLLGGFIKIIILIPVFIFLYALAIAFIFVSVLNSFYVLGTGKYWPTAYNFTLSFLRLTTKLTCFWYGLTDQYPGFTFNMPSEIQLNMAMPTNPSRLFALPVLGGLIRLILIIPYAIYLSVIELVTKVSVL